MSMKGMYGVPESDRVLIQQCRRGNAGAWRQVLNRYERLVFSIPLRYGLSQDDAADIAQLTFAALVQNIDNLAEDSRLGAWLSTVARRGTWRLLGRRRREIPSEHLESTSVAESAVVLGKSDADSIERWELTDWLDMGLSQLNERCRALLTALYFRPELSSYAEVAEHLGMPLGSVGPTRARCLKRFKRVLSGDQHTSIPDESEL
jgi:RNA polymerase sigma factor (sigma-70 family)